MNDKVNWGIISTGAIARTFALGLRNSRTGRLVAVGSRSAEKAEAFAKDFGPLRTHGSYDALLADRDVQAVYIATPHPQHAEWAIKAAEAGKHILLEKPFAVNAHEAAAVQAAAAENDVYLMEAFMYRCHPQTAKLVELLREKAIGEVRVIQATFSFHAGFNPNGRLYNNDLCGGGIMDVGCYPVSMSRLVAGAALGRDFADPLEVRGAGHLGQTGVDEWAVATLRFPGDIVAQCATGIAVNQENCLRVFGSGGSIFIPNPWMANRQSPDTGKIVLWRYGQPGPEELVLPAEVTSFTLEADVAGDAIRAGRRQAPAPAMSWDDTLGNMRALDAWRASLGLVYNLETRERQTEPITRRPLRKPSGAKMSYGRIPGLDKDISRLVLGVDNQDRMTHAAVMFDHYFEHGGNAFDTAWVYGAERSLNLGAWIRTRGVRKDVVVLVKGAHTPQCDPESLTRQLHESLEQLQIEAADLYLMHRDNPAIPAGEFIDVLNRHVKEGRIRAFGGSNWSLARVDEANDYARRKGLQGFSAVSNNFSLARLVNAPWGGSIATSDAASRAWFQQKQIALFSWASQAQGFFIEGRAAPDRLENRGFANTWYCEDNFRRLERANELARKKGVRPTNIALAYVLCQPFPAFALIGPRTPHETLTTLPGLDIRLTPEELRWLNLED